jgi:hypothetical protein
VSSEWTRSRGQYTGTTTSRTNLEMKLRRIVATTSSKTLLLFSNGFLDVKPV